VGGLGGRGGGRVGGVGTGLDLGAGREDRASFREPCLFMFFL
jgi:hypothetical protein